MAPAEGLIPGAGSALDALEGVIKGLAGTLTQLTEVISSTVGMVGQFVQALNPALMEQFAISIRDLMATIGVAFEPLVEVFTRLSRQVAGVLLPVMEQLRPVLQQLGETFGAILIPVVRVFASLLSAVAPLLKVIGDVFEALTPYIEATSVVFQALVNTLTSLLTSFLGGEDYATAVDALATAATWAAGQLLLFTARLADFFFGGKSNEFLDQMIEGIDRMMAVTQEGGVKAAQQPKGGSLESLARELALSAAKAIGGIGVESEDEKRQRRHEQLLDVMKGVRDEVAKLGTSRPAPPPRVPPQRRQGFEGRAGFPNDADFAGGGLDF